MENRKSTLAVFGKKFPKKNILSGRKFDTVIAHAQFKNEIEKLGCHFIDFDSLLEPGSIYEATALLEELPHLLLPSGVKVSKAFVYQDYELWWIHYNGLFHHFCIPYIQYKRLLTFLREFHHVTLFDPVHKSLFSSYLESYGVYIEIIDSTKSSIPFGIFIQIIATAVSVPLLILQRKPLLVFIGDKFERGKDYDSRMSFVYQELRKKKIPFVEFIRCLESWKILIQHIFVRKRPVIYSEAIAFVGMFLSFITNGRNRANIHLGLDRIDSLSDPEQKFKLRIATHFLATAYDDIWASRIMKCVQQVIGIRAGLFTSALDRNFHTVLGCKFNNIPTVGILHGVASRYYNPYDFMPGFDGEKSLSLDTFGVWSEWWKSYYASQGRAYTLNQLHVSGPMRPLAVNSHISTDQVNKTEKVRVLLISEQTAAPREVMPYLHMLMNKSNIELTVKFRMSRDGFEEWLSRHEPDVLKRLRIMRDMQEAIKNSDVVVGCHSTGVLEGLLQNKVPILMYTKKWGDYYEMAKSEDRKFFISKDPEELSSRIDNAHTITLGQLAILREQYFGDSNKNGSAWIVNRAEELLNRSR